MPKVDDDQSPDTNGGSPEGLRPFEFHGVDLEWKGGAQALADCPFCGREAKFSIEVATSRCSCFVCGWKGNAIEFLRELQRIGAEGTTADDLQELASERKLLDGDTLGAWGACRSILTREWLIPGRSTDAKLMTLYSWRWKADDAKFRLFPTPTMHHWPSMIDVAEGKPTVFICEGCWDGAALWEALSFTRNSGGEWDVTGNPSECMLAEADVWSIPGCNVFHENWAKALAGRKVVLCGHNDHPREHDGGRVTRPSWDGMRRIAGLLAGQAEVTWLNWGEPTELPDGWDVRDHLGQGADRSERIELLRELLSKVGMVPDEWTPGGRPLCAADAGRIMPEHCHDWNELLGAWKQALSMRRSIEDAMAVMLAVACSTVQKGDQLFLQLIGDAGSAKTRLCDALLVSSNCYPLEHLTGFHSGWNDGSGEDFSLLARINRKVLITPEGDVLMSSPKFDEIMSQQRRIFDGTSGASYKTKKEDLRYTGLRTPWIMAGTPALMDKDQSRLGDRFLRVKIEPPPEEDEAEILRRVAHAALREVREESGGDAAGCLEPTMLAAYRLTGGYVDWLREHATSLLNTVEVSDEALEQCMSLATFTASFRARPNTDKRKEEVHDSKELPTRLTKQYARLAACLAVVLNRPSVDADVMPRVRKVALDTAGQRTVRMAAVMFETGREGVSVAKLGVLTGESEDRARTMLTFLKKINVVEVTSKKSKGGITFQPRWRLTDRMHALWKEVMGNYEE